MRLIKGIEKLAQLHEHYGNIQLYDNKGRLVHIKGPAETNEHFNRITDYIEMFAFLLSQNEQDKIIRRGSGKELTIVEVNPYQEGATIVFDYEE